MSPQRPHGEFFSRAVAELSGNLSLWFFHLLPFLPQDKQMSSVLLFKNYDFLILT